MRYLLLAIKTNLTIACHEQSKNRAKISDFAPSSHVKNTSNRHSMRSRIVLTPKFSNSLPVGRIANLITLDEMLKVLL